MKLSLFSREAVTREGRRDAAAEGRQRYTALHLDGKMTGISTRRLPVEEAGDFRAAMTSDKEALRLGRNRMIAWGLGFAATALTVGLAYTELTGRTDFVDVLPEGTVVDFGMEQASVTPEKMPAQPAPTDTSLPLGQTTRTP